MSQVREYLTADGFSPFGNWFGSLDPVPRSRVATALKRLEAGNPGDWHGVGKGVMELRIHTGPGYRIYFARDGDDLILLLAGGTKHRQPRDIELAQDRWDDYRRRKRTEP